MKKEGLAPELSVKLRNGDIYRIMGSFDVDSKDKYAIVKTPDRTEIYQKLVLINYSPQVEILSLDEYKQDLTNANGNENMDVMEVYKYCPLHDYIFHNVDCLRPLWKREDRPRDYVLHAKSKNEALMFGFYEDNTFRDLGFITPMGFTKILSRSYMVDNYEVWREKGMMVDPKKTKWKGREYWVNNHYLFRSDLSGIYDFDDCVVYSGVNDENIVKLKHNKKPILY